jgi:AraC-like DNA-binding protein
MTGHYWDGKVASRPPTHPSTLLSRIYAFVERNLAEPDLSPASIANEHYISVRYLYKIFAAEKTTIASWIRRRRLERCCRDLADPEQSPLPVRAIAARWGFVNHSHFSRLFNATYGISPSSYRNMHVRPTNDAANNEMA